MNNHFIFRNRYPVLGNRYPALRNRYPVLGNRYPVLGNRYPVLGKRNINTLDFINLTQIDGWALKNRTTPSNGRIKSKPDGYLLINPFAKGDLKF